MRLYGQVRRREVKYVGRRIPKIEVPGRRRGEGQRGGGWMGFERIGRKGVLLRRMWLAEGCGGRRRAVATPKWESC